ncbi:MAG: hypothetical protein DHS20C02_17630 [Micavibrio sp.]|nr:MAG: hypothetical protein DHS20C02_17630 [Micavibrio sp.]
MKKHNLGNENGSVLLLVPILLMVLGLFMVGTIKKAETKSFYGEVRTHEKMERIQKALSIHANRYYRVPCPADPNDNPINATFGTERADCETVAADQVGIVPFRELGLTEFDVRDVWGNYFTFAVSPSYTRTPVVGGKIPGDWYIGGAANAPATDLPVPYNSDPLATDPALESTINPANLTSAEVAKTFVHKYCRRAGDWIESSAEWHRGDDGTRHDLKGNGFSNVSLYRSLNKNNYKAQYCCASNVGAYDTFYAEDHKAQLRLNPNSYQWKNLSFATSNPRWGGCTTGNAVYDPWGSGGAYCPPEGRVKGALNLNYGEKVHGLKGGMSPRNSWSPTHGKFVAHTLYIDLDDYDDTTSGAGTVGLILGIADLEGEEAEDYFVYSVELYDVVTDEVLVNPDTHNYPWPDFDPDHDGDQNADGDPSTSNYDSNLFHNSYQVGGVVVGGIGKFELNVSDFEEQIMAMGHDPANIRLKKAHFHSDGMSSQLASVEVIKNNGPDNDLVVENENDDTFLNPRGRGGYRPGDEAVNEDVSAPEAPAYTLVSHGENGAGAFIVGTTTQIDDSNAGDKEQENARHGNRTFTSQRRVIAIGNDHFDDIVLWDSQMSLYNVLPNATCETAQAEVN